MTISLIVAASANQAIGMQNQLLWHLPNDLKFFKNTTWAMPVLMGRKTFESLGGKPLKGRLNIILTHQKDWQADGVVVVHSLEDAVFLAKTYDYKELMIAGGGEIYQQTLPKADRVYLTRVHVDIEGDTFFPVLGKDWKMTAQEHRFADAKHAYNYSFETWERK